MMASTKRWYFHKNWQHKGEGCRWVRSWFPASSIIFENTQNTIQVLVGRSWKNKFCSCLLCMLLNRLAWMWMPDIKKNNYLDVVVEFCVGMRPGTCISTYHVTAMTVFVKIKFVIKLCCNISVGNTNANPFQIISVDSECKCLDLVLKIKRRVHQGHLINWVLGRLYCKRIYNLYIVMDHHGVKLVKFVRPKRTYLVVDILHFWHLFSQHCVKAFNSDLNDVFNVDIRVFQEIQVWFFIWLVVRAHWGIWPFQNFNTLQKF